MDRWEQFKAYGRDCIVDNTKMIFHRWIDEEYPIVKVNAFLPDESIKKAVKAALFDNYVGPELDVFIVKATFALVEDLEGNVRKVKPESVRFI